MREATRSHLHVEIEVDLSDHNSPYLHECLSRKLGLLSEKPQWFLLRQQYHVTIIKQLSGSHKIYGHVKAKEVWGPRHV